MRNYGLVAALAAFLWLTAPLAIPAADEPTPPAEPDKPDKNDKQEKPVPEPKVWTSRHRIRIGGKAIDYEATSGTLLMKNEKDEPIALFGFTAYVRQGQDARTRPIVFAYNGGPGSASAWLHMGILGPRRALIEDLTNNTRGPFKLVDNEFSPLDRADLVLIDPVGTGFSRPVGKAEGKQFWGVDNDIRSVSDFIVRYLGEYQRWGSPKFILGESYGGIRTGGVSYDLLTRHNVALNGIILVSDWDLGHVQPDSNGRKIPYANVLPDISYTMTMNPKMRILVQQGYFDLACPYGTVKAAIDHLNITPELRRNVHIEYYEAGHMMYVHPDSMGRFSEITKAFIDGNSN